MAAFNQNIASLAHLTLPKDIIPAPFREPPGLERLQQVGTESCFPLPPCPRPVTTGDTDPVWRACEEYLHNEYKERIKSSQGSDILSWMFQAKQSPHLQSNHTHTGAAPTIPLMPPGILLPAVKSPSLTCNNVAKAAEVLKRDDSSHSLGSTTTGGSDGDKHEDQSFNCMKSPTMQATIEQTMRDLRIERMENGGVKAQWRLDARKIRGKDKQVISPSFEVYPGSSFKLMVRPKSMGDKKGQANFSKAHGCGAVDLKLMCGTASAPKLRFCISVGEGAPRGPVAHDFGNNSVGGLPHNDEIFDFKSAVDSTTSTVLISVEVLPESS